MGEFLRKTHLYAGVSAAAFLFMYFITGYVMIHHSWFPDRAPVKTTRTEEIRLPGGMESEQAAGFLAGHFGIRGKAQPPRRLGDGRWRFNWNRPGHAYEVLLSPDGASATFTGTESGFRQTMIVFHRLHGYGGGALYDAWVFMYDFSSASLIVFAFTGLGLWLGKRERNFFGWLCLAAGTALTVAMILYFMYMP